MSESSELDRKRKKDSSPEIEIIETRTTGFNSLKRKCEQFIQVTMFNHGEAEYFLNKENWRVQAAVSRYYSRMDNVTKEKARLKSFSNKLFDESSGSHFCDYLIIMDEYRDVKDSYAYPSGLDKDLLLDFDATHMSEISLEKRKELIGKLMYSGRLSFVGAKYFLKKEQWDCDKALERYFSKLELLEDAENRFKEGKKVSANETSGLEHKIVFSFNNIRIVSWNLDGLDERSLNSRTYAAIEACVKENPDIILLQEVIPETQTILQTELRKYNYQFISANSDAQEYPYFSALALSKRFKVKSTNIYPFPGSLMSRHLVHVSTDFTSLCPTDTAGLESNEQEEYRKAIPFEIFTSHLESCKEYSDERSKQLEHCFSQLVSNCTKNNAYGIFSGDLNLRDKEVKQIGIPPQVVDVWQATGSRKECQHTWDARRNTNIASASGMNFGCRFDRMYFFTPQNTQLHVAPKFFGLVGLEKVKNSSMFPSDHWGIRAICEIKR